MTEPADNVNSQSPSPSQRSRIKWVLLGLLVTIVLGAAGAYYFSSPSDDARNVFRGSPLLVKSDTDQLRDRLQIFEPRKCSSVGLWPSLDMDCFLMRITEGSTLILKGIILVSQDGNACITKKLYAKSADRHWITRDEGFPAVLAIGEWILYPYSGCKSWSLSIEADKGTAKAEWPIPDGQ